MNRKIESIRWEEFFKDFSFKNNLRPTRLEILADLGAQTQVRGLPFGGIDLDSKGRDAPAIEILLGGQHAGDAHISHVITDPKEVYVKLGEDGEDEVLEIENEKGAKTLLHFERREELVD